MVNILHKKDLRSENLELLRLCLRRVRQATKPQMAEYTGLSVVTVNSLLQDLLLNGEAAAAEEAESSGGRRAQTYSFNAEHRLALIIYMHEKTGRDTMFISVDDLLGNTLEISELQPKKINLEYFTEVLRPYFNKYPQISVIVVGLPGVEVKGKLVISDYPGLQDTMFCQSLSAQLQCPVIFENDINVTVAGYIYSLEEKYRQETVVGIYFPQNYLPGAGIFVKGNLYRGRDGIAGEMGHCFRTFKPKHKIKFADKASTVNCEAIRNAVQAILLFVSTWNPHRIVIYSEIIQPAQTEFIRKCCVHEISEEFLPEITIKSEIYEDYKKGIRCLAAEYLNNKK
ncbi:ROK family protein [Pectinatus haikarae]|uniref:CRP-like cAMP-binding protein n=1 Tax=Pectinatus haikarae TaxID=349096 RepID=A0ABT9Y459_9FIRM|nr:ROK family protein [Pectinatus haikarae]MDQ0202607.1 CRP-like cAMP-binding protein [Pectinatus haikarae]